MKIIIILLFGLLLTNCSNQKKVIKSPNDLQSFVNVFCEKHKSDDKVIKVCSNGFSKDLNIATQKSLISGKLKLADIVSHSLVSNEVITHKESGKGIVKEYSLEATSTLDEVSISNYRVVHTKVILEKGGYRVMHLLSLKIS